MKKKFLAKFIAFLMVFAIALPISANTKPETAYAATAALSTTWKTIIMGNTYTFKVKNATNVKTKSWSSSNKKVATISGTGKVTPKAPGKTAISCKIFFKDGTTKTLKATVAVKKRIKAESMTLNAKIDQYNMQTMKVGETYQFVKSVTPSDATDWAYFTIYDKEIASVTSKGLVTALKPGITVLEARCGMNATDAKRTDNTATTKVYLYVVGADTVTPTPSPSVLPTPVVTKPSVTNVSLTSSKEIRIDFSNPILESSVINSNGELISGTVIITALPDASNYYSIKPTLSSDKKSLMLTATGTFEGKYIITTSESILTTDSNVVAPYTVQKNLKDVTGPSYAGSSTDETGYVARISFSEQIDISNMSIFSVSSTANTLLQSYLMDTSHYTLSEDRKSLTIDLSSCGVKTADVLIQLLGIKDIAGNTSSTTTISAVVQIDATEKPLANITNVQRVSKSIVTVTFDRPMLIGGYMLVGSQYIAGVVDATDKYKVNFTLNDTNITGTQLVEFSNWQNYNAYNMQTAAIKRTVNFTLDSTPPVIANFTVITETVNMIPVTKLTLTYNKAVTLMNGSGSMDVRVISTNSNIYNEKLTYTAEAKGKVVTLSFRDQAKESGAYTFAIPEGLVMDQYENLSKATTVNTNKQTSNSNALPAPVSVAQDTTNPSVVYVKFTNKLDIPSAEIVTNYMFGTNVYPTSASVTAQSDTSATVKLTFANGVFSGTKTYPVSIKGIKGYNSSYGVMETYNSTVTLVENSGPIFTGAKLISPNYITVTFSKAITGTIDIVVYDGSNVVYNTYTVSDNTVFITLGSNISTAAYVMFTNNKLVDAHGNAAILTTDKKISVIRSY